MSTINNNKDKVSKDGVVCFNEEKHIYYLSKDPSFRFTSCTTVIKDFHEPFNADKVSDKVVTSKGYTGEAKAKKKEELKKEWADSAIIGTYVHKLLEDLCDKTVSNDNFKHYYPQMTAVIKFYADYIASGKYEVVSTEDILYSISLGISGQRDLKIREVATGKLINVDLKTSKVIDKVGYKGKKMLGAFKELDDCRYNKYSIQLTIYNYLDEDKAEESWILHVHTDGEYYIHQALPLEIEFSNPNNFRSIYIKNKDLLFANLLNSIKDSVKGGSASIPSTDNSYKSKQHAELLGHIESIEERDNDYSRMIDQLPSDEDIFMQILNGVIDNSKDNEHN